MWTALFGGTALYYLKTSEEDTKFPATYSYMVRKGLP